MPLYPDQIDFYQNLSKSVANNKRIIGCAATGFGKSKVFIAIAQTALQRGIYVLVLTESTKIFNQLAAEIGQCYYINPDATHTDIKLAIYVAMAQTLARRPELLSRLAALNSSLIVLNDEAHIGTATKVLQQMPNALLIGFTATPDMKFARHLPTLYNDIVIGSQPHWLVANNRLTPYQHDQVFPSGLNELKIGANGDYSEVSQERVFDKPESQRFVPIYLNKYKYTKCMIFCASIKSAESLSSFLKSNNIPNTCQHSKRNFDEANKELEGFHSNTYNICISVGSMNKGYDFPIVDLIILYRATTSLPLYLQMCGRGSRKAPNKTIWTVVDFGGNGRRLGRWDFEHDWANRWNKIPKKRDAIAPVKDCPKCMYILPVTAAECPNCGHVFKKPSKSKIDTVKSVMLEEVANLKGKRLSQLSPYQLMMWAKCNNKLKFAIRIARAKELEEQGFLEEFAKVMGYKSAWVDFQYPSKDEKIPFFDKLIQ